MKTEDILNLDCTKEENRAMLTKFLWKIKPISRLKIPKGCEPSIEDLEKVMHGIMVKYEYRLQGISMYFEEGKFIFYKADMIKHCEKERQWCGTVYGKTLWEVVAKTIIKIYGEVMKERKENERN